MVLIITSVVTNDVGYLFICLFAICRSPVMSFAHFLVGLCELTFFFLFLLLTFESSLYMLDTKPLIDM